jgi:hypothetical protein
MREIARKNRPHLPAALGLAAKFLIPDTLREIFKPLKAGELLSPEVPWNQDFNLSRLFSRL